MVVSLLSASPMLAADGHNACTTNRGWNARAILQSAAAEIANPSNPLIYFYEPP